MIAYLASIAALLALRRRVAKVLAEDGVAAEGALAVPGVRFTRNIFWLEIFCHGKNPKIGCLNHMAQNQNRIRSKN